MRSVAQSLLARHPVVSGVGVGCRWVLWLMIGHPFGLIALGLAIVAGLPWWYRAIVWSGTETVLGLWGFAGLTTGAQSLQLWGHMCRFRRRWPGQFARAYRLPWRPPVVVDNHYSVPGGLRPTFAAPRLSVLPRAFDHRTIGWRLLLLADHDLVETAAAVGRIGGSDDRVGSITLRCLPGGDLALIVRFRSLGAGRSSRLATGLGSLVIDETGGSAIDPWDDLLLRPSPSLSSSDRDADSDWDGRKVLLGEPVGQPADTTGEQVRPRNWRGAGSSAPRRGVDDGDAGSRLSDPDPGLGPGPDDFVSNLPPSRPGPTRRSDFPMKWSFSVILPSNILMAIVVAASDAGRIAVMAVCAAALVSLVLIIAEGVAHR